MTRHQNQPAQTDKTWRSNVSGPVDEDTGLVWADRSREAAEQGQSMALSASTWVSFVKNDSEIMERAAPDPGEDGTWLAGLDDAIDRRERLRHETRHLYSILERKLDAKAIWTDGELSDDAGLDVFPISCSPNLHPGGLKHDTALDGAG